MVSPVSGELALLRMQVVQLQDQLNAERQDRVDLGASNCHSGSDPVYNFSRRIPRIRVVVVLGIRAAIKLRWR